CSFSAASSLPPQTKNRRRFGSSIPVNTDNCWLFRKSFRFSFDWDIGRDPLNSKTADTHYPAAKSSLPALSRSLPCVAWVGVEATAEQGITQVIDPSAGGRGVAGTKEDLLVGFQREQLSNRDAQDFSAGPGHPAIAHAESLDDAGVVEDGF